VWRNSRQAAEEAAAQVEKWKSLTLKLFVQIGFGQCDYVFLW
jgi:hypothetical protein